MAAVLEGEWRRIRAWPRYMVSRDGRVSVGGSYLMAVMTDHRGDYVLLRRTREDEPYRRYIADLVRIEFERDDSSEPAEEWRIIPGFPDYQMSKTDVVKCISTGNVVRQYVAKRDVNPGVTLKKDGVRVRMGLARLSRLVWGSPQEQETEDGKQG